MQRQGGKHENGHATYKERKLIFETVCGLCYDDVCYECDFV